LLAYPLRRQKTAQSAHVLKSFSGKVAPNQIERESGPIWESLNLCSHAYRSRSGGIARNLKYAGRLSAGLWTPQNSQDRSDCIPVPRCRGCAVQLVDLAQITDGLHVPAVHPKYELPSRLHNPHQPLPIGRKYDWERILDAARFRQNAHEPNSIRGARFGSKRILHLQAHKLAAFAHHNLRYKRQLTLQRNSEFCSRPWFANNKCSGGPYIHHIVVAQFTCQNAWTKASVPANIHASKKDHESHPRIMKKKLNRRYPTCTQLTIRSDNRRKRVKSPA